MRSAVDPNAAVASIGASIDTGGAASFDAAGEEAFSGPLSDVAAADLELAAVLGALSDPLRLRIVATLAEGGEWTCGSLELPIAKSTKSHHLRVLGEAGIVSRRVDGKCRMLRLRREALDERFPGLLDAVLAAAPAVPSAATAPEGV
ncbi:helix-turn-helix transcriptional regulator [Conexibacter sp. DBS9H8]|uniref:ArsR/SmtB family transcription factor n=1 Tax=Conexibacter sp. DBS9H8 TaxID=2937801 RepID=UPI00200FD9F4|nr:metalloregulator ArsR/SmtB family transcription factor [Conexibacter sp. DBS9H8]